MISGTEVVGDIEGGRIEERVTEARARELLLEWKRIVFAYEKEGKNADALFHSGSGA